MNLKRAAPRKQYVRATTVQVLQCACDGYHTLDFLYFHSSALHVPSPGSRASLAKSLRRNEDPSPRGGGLEQPVVGFWESGMLRFPTPHLGPRPPNVSCGRSWVALRGFWHQACCSTTAPSPKKLAKSTEATSVSFQSLPQNPEARAAFLRAIDKDRFDIRKAPNRACWFPLAGTSS